MKNRFSSPTLPVRITPERYELAKRSKSGSCVIADSMAAQFPNLSKISVDMATIRATDRQRGVRYIYLTPPAAQQLLLGFDAGWASHPDLVVVQRAVQIVPIRRSARDTPKQKEARADRLARLEAKAASGEPMTKNERMSLTKLRKPYVPMDRPTTQGPPELSSHTRPVVYGGQSIPQGKAHPNLLRGTDRHYGAKLADPGLAFNEAVDAAVAARLAES